jgi:hypothetical protein
MTKSVIHLSIDGAIEDKRDTFRWIASSICCGVKVDKAAILIPSLFRGLSPGEAWCGGCLEHPSAILFLLNEAKL